MLVFREVLIYQELVMENLFKILPKKAENIYYSDANIYLNGKLIKPSALPVFSDDTFYIPIDLLNEIQKNEIHIDEKNVFIGTPPSQKEPINDICPPCAYTNSEFKKIITIDKKSYTDSILFDTKRNNIHSEIAYKLNGLYNTMSFELIKITDVTDKDAYFCIMADMEILASAKLADLEKTSNFSISLDNVDTLRFFSVSPDKNIKFIITNICTN